MPQMSPMWWTTMMIMFIMLMIIMMTMLYFNFQKKIMMNFKMNFKKMNWKW
nr:ATP synthase F0 subunit 8 [Thaia sp. 1 NZ-2023b]